MKLLRTKILQQFYLGDYIIKEIIKKLESKNVIYIYNIENNRLNNSNSNYNHKNNFNNKNSNHNIDNNNYNNINVNINKIKKLKILHLSDTHFYKNNKLLEEYKKFDLIFKNIEFDIILHSGDICDNLNEFDDIFINFLKNLKSKYGKYYVLGNHEYYKSKNESIKNKLRKLNYIMNKTGFKNITNSNIKLISNKYFNLNLIGLDDDYLGKPNLDLALKDVNKNDFNILLTHNLDALDYNYINYFNLVFSGHLHSGEFNLGLLNGVDYLKFKSHFKNKYKQINGFKLLNSKEFINYSYNNDNENNKDKNKNKDIYKICLSFIHPGNYCGICDKISFLNRPFTKKAGIVIHNFSWK